jgi:hypothetical protein
MQNPFIKTLVILLIAAMPMSVCFADAAIDAKAAEVKARLLRDFAPPKASQHLSTSNRNAYSQSMNNGQAPMNQQNPSQAVPPPAPPTEAPPASQSPGSWYVQPGDSGAKSNGSSGSSSFNHGNLY